MKKAFGVTTSKDYIAHHSEEGSTFCCKHCDFTSEKLNRVKIHLVQKHGARI